MFDAQTVALIRSAPPLEGLELEDLPKELTRAYSTMVSMRMRLRQILTADVFETELGDVIRRLETLALTQEAFVTATPERSNRAAAAFVAVGLFQNNRLNMLLNSARIFNVYRSLIRNVRPRFMFSVGRRCVR